MKAKRIRAWERSFEAGESGYRIPLRFRVVPGNWPDITLTGPDYSGSDVAADEYEIEVVYSLGHSGLLTLSIEGVVVKLDRSSMQQPDLEARADARRLITARLYVGLESVELEVDGACAGTVARTPRADRQTVSAVTENVAEFVVEARPRAFGILELAGDATLLSGKVYGLRPERSEVYERIWQRTTRPGKILYQSPQFVVADHYVEDSHDIPALVPDRRTICSPLRVTEEFEWRDNPYGDMTRIVDRRDVWYSNVEPWRFPRLRTRFATVDAAFELAEETFQRNSDGEFSLPGQSGIWSAGYFQGPGEGFGCWRRDTVHTAIRGGNLIDRDSARHSLEYILTQGFDNGSDGLSLPAVGVCDYLHATGDASLVEQNWDTLADLGRALDQGYSPSRGLVAAPQSTSNDLFPEPESGGYTLSTEIYAMRTYSSLSAIAEHIGCATDETRRWHARAETLKATVLKEYWNDERGYFTKGPRGSDAYKAGVWETSGSEAAVWGFLGPEAEQKVRSVLRRVREIAGSPYGLVLFPGREGDNHFCNSVWYVWQAGFARAAARNGDAVLVRDLIAQQTRSAVLNKTFYEVTDAYTGKSWRWPGQLWHAAGFVSLVLYGLLGMTYDGGGLRFRPAVSSEFSGVTLAGLQYRDANLNIEVSGCGTRYRTLLDGKDVLSVPSDVSGEHDVLLVAQG